MNEFLKKVLNSKVTSHEVYNNIIKQAIQKNALPLSSDDLDEEVYNSEKLMNNKIYRGNIYIFDYTAKEPTLYSYKKASVYFTDTTPVVLVTSESRTTLRGINLNFCNKALKTIILNAIQNLDVDFYNGGAAKIEANGGLPISNNVYKFFSGDGEKELIKQLNRAYPGVDYSFIFRSYAVSNIRTIHLIEPWQWQDLPFLNYEGSLKNETLKAIQKISGIEKINL